MNNFYFETYHLWHPDFRQALSQAIRQRSPVTVSGNMAIDECNKADLLLAGRFVGFSGSFIQFVVENFTPYLASNYPEDPECEYAFTDTIEQNGSEVPRLEYGGRAYIIDRELQPNGIPESLLLRLSPPSRLRRLRKHDRISSPEGIFLMPGLLVMDQEPLNRRRLLALLAHYYKQTKRPKPHLVDISAGGACLKTSDAHCLRFAGTDESFLFFFFSEKDGILESPNVFLAKKVGLFRDENAQHTGLRIKFIKELIWTGPNEELKWQNIEFSGSEKIKEMFTNLTRGDGTESDSSAEPSDPDWGDNE